MVHNELTELDAWMYFLGSDRPEDILRIMDQNAVEYMVDELKAELAKQKAELEKLRALLEKHGDFSSAPL